MLRFVVTTVAVLELAISSQASVRITHDAGTVSRDLPGYRTYRLTAITDDGSQIVGFDFASLPAYGFFGRMNQVNPVGQPTIFTDNNRSYGIRWVPIQSWIHNSSFRYWM